MLPSLLHRSVPLRPGCQIPRPCPSCGASFVSARQIHRHTRLRRRAATYAAAVEEPPTVADESTSSEGSSEADFDNAMDFQSSDALYRRFDQLLETTKMDLAVGDRVSGIIVSADDKGAFVDLGLKAPALCPATELTNSMKVRDFVEVGQQREFQVVYKSTHSKAKWELTLSLKEVERDVVWARLKQMQEEGIAVEARSKSANRGGLICEVYGIEAFLPSSHIPQDKKTEAGLEELIGETFEVSLMEVDKEATRLVLSNRAQTNVSTEELQSFKVGDVALGTVMSVQVYGAFVELAPNVSGLLHVSQISHDRVNSVDKVLSVGDKIKVMVLTHDNERGRLSLSTRKLEPSPGDMLRDPALVFERAEEMAANFRQQVAEAEVDFGLGG